MKTLPSTPFLAAAFLCVSACSDSQSAATSTPADGGTADARVTQVVPDARVDTGTHKTSSDASPLEGGAGNLGCSTRETLVENVTSAENLMFVNGTERLLVSSDDGIFEMIHGTTAAVILQKRTAAATCKFGGMTQIGAVLFANCYDLTDSHVYAAEVGATPMFESIYDLPGVKLANGLTADTEGHLYVASTLDGRILRLTVAGTGALRVTDETAVGVLPAPFAPNGIKLFQGSLYVTSGGEIWTVSTPSADGGADARKLVAQANYLDDLFVTAATIFVDDFGGGAIHTYDLDGNDQGATPKKLLASPSSVLPANGRFGLGMDDLVVTEKGANRVAVVHPCAF